MHTPEHWNFLSTLKDLKKWQLCKLGDEFDSVYLSNDSFRSSKLAIGCLLAITEEVVTDRVIF